MDVTATSIGTGGLEIEIDLPKSVKGADVFIFDVVDSNGHAGTVVFSRLESDDD